MTRQEVIDAIVRGLQRTNELREPDNQVPSSEDTRLFGKEGLLDSLELVALIIDVEQTIADSSGANVVLADERAMAESHNPFRDVQSLANYVMARLEGT